MAPSNGLERKFHIHMNNAVFCKYSGSWKESCQGSWKELKMNLFGDIFWTTEGRVLRFCRMVYAWHEHLLTRFQAAATNSLRVIAVFVFKNYWPKFARAQCQWSLGPPELILVVKFEFQWCWCYFWQETCQWHPKTFKLLQKCNGLERKLFWNDCDKLSLFLMNLIWFCWVVKQWT